jgi:3-oxoacyl-[acyl-carrier-protein] synthase II
MAHLEKASVAITGVGLVTPLGLGAPANVVASLAGKSGIGSMDEIGCEGLTCSAAAVVPSFDIDNILRFPKNLKYMTHAVKCATRAAREAVDQSGISGAGLDPWRIALYTASGQSGLEYDEFFRSLSLAWPDSREMDFKDLGGIPSRLIDPYFSIRTLANGGLGLISMELGIRGPNANYVHSGSASAQSLMSGYNDLIENRCDAAVVGGYDSLLSHSSLLAYLKAGLLSPSPADSAYRPFDRHRDGLVLGAGAGFLVLERPADARLRGASILAEVRSVNCAMELAGGGLPAISAQTMTRLVTEALDEGIEFVVAAGIGTAEADRAEAAALCAAVGCEIPITALKSHTGYLGAATAVVELCIGLLCARQKLIPPIARHSASDEDCRLNLVCNESRAVASNAPSGLFLSYSWGGQVAAIVARAGMN